MELISHQGSQIRNDRQPKWIAMISMDDLAIKKTLTSYKICSNYFIRGKLHLQTKTPLYYIVTWYLHASLQRMWSYKGPGKIIFWLMYVVVTQFALLSRLGNPADPYDSTNVDLIP